MTIPPIRLAFGATLWRVFAVLAVFREFAKWQRLEFLQAMHGTGFRIAALILMSPRILFRAFVIAAIVTVLLDLYVRLIMRPILARWYNPRRRSDEVGMPLSFGLTASETILDELPARIVSGHRKKPGTLVRTDRRLWFSPFGWDEEPVSIGAADLRSIEIIETPSRLGSLVLGLPDRLAIRDRDGVETQFVVADPRDVLAWYDEEIRKELEDHQPATTELF
jgi:hypothetical protein